MTVGPASGHTARKLLSNVEPNTVCQRLLQVGSCHVYGDGGDHDRNALVEVKDFHKVETLCLSFNNIFEIDNLSDFASLKTLRLDNNIIDCIQNINHLAQLTWLDLSFNNISKMQGLSHLPCLSDLILCNNRISKIEGLDNCQRVQVLSLANNSIGSLTAVDYLRSFEQLRCLSLGGNPLCLNDKYTMHLLAYLPNLLYLDFKPINGNVDGVHEYNTDELSELREHEQIKQDALINERARQDLREQMKLLYIFDLQHVLELGERLFDDEDSNLKTFSWYIAAKQEFIDSWRDRVGNLQSSLLPVARRRTSTYQNFQKAVAKTIADADMDGSKFIAECQIIFSSSLRRLREQDLESGSSQLRAQFGIWKSKLIHDETILHTSINDSLNEIEGELEASVKNIEDAVMTFFQSCCEHGKQFISNLHEVCHQACESSSHGNDEYDDGQRMFLSDRESIQILLSGFQDSLQMRVESAEDKETQVLRMWVKAFIDESTKNEHFRNRARAQEIVDFIDGLESELNSIEAQQKDDADDF